MAEIGSLDFLRNLDDAEFLEEMVDLGMVPPLNVQQAQAADRVSRMTELQPGSPQFQAAVSGLVDQESKRGMIGMTRRAAQQFTTLREIDGDVNREMIWIVEGDDRSCDPCMGNAAEIHTFAEWQEIGLPGSATCDGGDYCRCDLYAV
jgi:hypothetical protein